MQKVLIIFPIFFQTIQAESSPTPFPQRRHLPRQKRVWRERHRRQEAKRQFFVKIFYESFSGSLLLGFYEKFYWKNPYNLA